MSETPDTPKGICPDCLRPPGNPSCVTCRRETPDTPSTEALTPDLRAAARTLETYIIRAGDPKLTPPTWQDAMSTLDILRAGRQEAADTSGLREAIEALPSIIFTPDQDASAGDVVYRADVLAALEGATERPLDVELLAEAIARINERRRLDDGFEWYASPRQMAEDIIAALASPTTTTPETGG